MKAIQVREKSRERRRPIGRPPGPPTTRLSLLVSPETAERIRFHSTAAGISMGAYVDFCTDYAARASTNGAQARVKGAFDK